VRGSEPFRFVDTHLEACHPRVCGAQAGEVVASGGPATSDSPVILVGDLNSDDDTVQGADRLAYEALLDAGMVPGSEGGVPALIALLPRPMKRCVPGRVGLVVMTLLGGVFLPATPCGTWFGRGRVR
jgi:endonuclease/exonuclease/phosphatase family metal-dependent hydrolase